MKKISKNAFSVAELTIVITIIGILFSVGIPMVIKNAKAKIASSQQYTAFKTKYDGVKKVRLMAPTHDLRVIRSGRFNVGTCDLFADTYSVISDGTNTDETTLVCPDGLPYNTGDNRCDSYTLTDRERCPDGTEALCMSGGSLVDCDSFPALAADPARFCYLTPQMITHHEHCHDGTTRRDPDVPEIPLGFYNDEANYASRINDRTNFDTATPNFTTLNGMRFFGLERYPIEQICPNNDLAGNPIDSLTKADTCGCLQYRNVYVDTNGKNTTPKENNCGCSAGEAMASCNAIAPVETPDCLECLKNTYGVYKFRLYNDGIIEPLTDRNVTNDRMKFKLSYVKNGEIVEVPALFDTYQQAREHQLSGGDAENFTYLRKTQLGATSDVARISGSYVNVEINNPCLNTEYFNANKCEIKLITPEIELSQGI